MGKRVFFFPLLPPQQLLHVTLVAKIEISRAQGTSRKTSIDFSVFLTLAHPGSVQEEGSAYAGRNACLHPVCSWFAECNTVWAS